MRSSAITVQDAEGAPNLARQLLFVLMADPERSDDADARFAEFGEALADAVAAEYEAYLGRVVSLRAGAAHGSGASAAEVDRLAAAVTAAAVAGLRRLAVTEIDEQRVTPLQVLRRELRPLTAWLVDQRLPVPPRDEVAKRADPHDLYDLAPATFADVGPATGSAGIAWGAAKAHVHLARRAS